MADLYDILNSGILDNYQNKGATLKINKPGIAGSIPNYNLNKIAGGLGKVSKAGGILGTAVPFYKDFAFPVANDMYKAIQGNPDSKILKFFMDMANVNPNQNQVNSPVPKENIQEKLDNGLIPLPELDELGKSDLQKNSVSNNKVSTSKQANIIANQVVNNKLNESPLEGSSARVPSEDDINILNDYINRLQGIREPYVNALENYLNNYYKNLDQARRADLYFYGANLAKGLNPKAGEKFNPLQNQADIINTIKLISDANAGDLNAINELQGNMAVAKEIGLPQQSAFANKNLLTALSYDKKYNTDLEKAKIVDAMRRYGYDTNFLRTLMSQEMKGDTAEKVARIYMGLDGEPGLGLTSQGTAQQQTYNPIAQRQSAEQNYYKQILGH